MDLLTRPTSTYPDWKAPTEDGAVLLWPEVPALIEQTLENHRRLGASGGVRIQAIPLDELRRAMREYLGLPPEQPLIAAGHQIELYHPGVWAKNIFINELANRVDGAACHFAVETDAPKHLTLRWPAGVEPITDDARLSTAQWAEMLDAPTPAHLNHIERSFEAAAKQWPFASLLPAFFASMRRSLLDSTELPRVLVNATHQLDWELGLRHHAMLTGPIWRSQAYLLFVHHVLARAGEFADIYNRALADYRSQMGIRNAGRPWPDLKLTDDESRMEAPFWLDDLAAGARLRASVIGSGGTWSLVSAAGEAFELNADEEGWSAASRLDRFLHRYHLRLSPRAMMLTAFLRLCVCDQFVHGIGGGRYDQVTDQVIERFFGIAAPSFSVTTATLLFPTAAAEMQPDLPAMKREGRSLRHRLLDGPKHEMVNRIASLPRNSAGRRELFFEMHRRLRENLHHPTYKQWEEQSEAAKRTAQSQRDLFDRELFYAIQPRDRLHSLIHHYHRQFKPG